MKKLLLLTSVIIISCLAYGQRYQSTQLLLHSFKESKSKSGMANLGPRFMENWPKDDNGEDCAWVRVRFENMPMNDAEAVSFSFGNSVGIRDKRNRLKEEENEIWLFVSPSTNAFMEARLDKYGTSNRLPNIKLEPMHVYDVILKNDKTISINIITQPEGAIATLETGHKAGTPATMTNVTLGTHTLTISLDGRIVKREEIEVSENNVKFEYDLRPEKEVTFTSSPSGAVLFIDGERIGRTPQTVKLHYDSYNIEAKLGPNETDSRSITVSERSNNRIELEPIQKKTFEVFATYNGEKVNADLYIDGEHEGSRQPSYTLTKPIGKSYNMNMIYRGDSKKRKIKVSKEMDEEQEFKISARNSIVWPWQRDYQPAPLGLSIGYVNKQLVTISEDGRKYKEIGFWNNGDGRFLHGVQFGGYFQPCFPWGLGLYTGIFCEFYLSSDDVGFDVGGAAFKDFSEADLYLPLHAYFRLPLAEKIALSFHGGIGFDLTLEGYYSFGSGGDIDAPYATDGYPRRINLTGEFGIGLRLGPILISGQYSTGILDHKSYASYGNFKTIQNKMSFSISYLMVDVFD